MLEIPVPKPISKKGLRMYRTEGGFLRNLFLLPNRVEIHGLKNRIEEGPSLIVCNHTGAAKDVAVISRVFGRMVFFCAMYYLFDRDMFSREIQTNYMRLLVPARLPRALLDVVITPVREFFAWYISSRLREVGTIPFKLEHLSPNSAAGGHENIKETIKGYLLAGRAVVLMQADSIQCSVFHPYISRFKRGAAGIALELYKSKAILEVPVTPVSIYGAEGLLTIGRRLIVRIGEPMTIKPFLDRRDPAGDFTAALEKRVADLVRLDVDRYGMPKAKFQKYVRREI